MMVYTTHYASPVGDLLLAEQDGGLIGLWIKGQKYYPGSPGEGLTQAETPLLHQTKLWLDCYFAGRKPAIGTLKLTPPGSPFRRTVWGLLGEIPYGQTITYGALAKQTAARLGRDTLSAQAVGSAVGHNPISIILPCHRVVGANGSLTGYAGGLEKKVFLLTHEGADMTRLFVPQ